MARFFGRQIYYGWYILAAAVFLYMLLLGTTYATFGLLVVPVSREFNLSRADTNSALILLNIGNGVVSPIFGRLVDLYPIKRIMIGGAILFGVSFIILGLSHSLWLNVFTIVVLLAAGLEAAGTMPITVLVARWFAANRGRALTILTLGLSLIGILVTPGVALLLSLFGWRSTLIAIGCIVPIAIFAFTLFFRTVPGPDDIEPASLSAAPVDPDGPDSKTVTIKAMLLMPIFWVTVVSVGFSSALAQGFSVSLAPMALDRGFTLLQATSLLSAVAIAGIVGKAILALIADRFDRGAMLAVLFLSVAVVAIPLSMAASYQALLLCCAAWGVVIGMIMPINLAFIVDRFGIQSFGTVRGTVATLSALGTAIFIRFSGEVFDRTGNYTVLFLTFIAMGAVAAAVLFAASRKGRSSAARLSALSK